MTKSNYLKLLLGMLCSFVVTQGFSQSMVSGKISESNGDAVIGASVQIPGTTTGTITDADGMFSLSTTQNPPFKISVSSIGYDTQEVDVTSANATVNVTMAANSSIFDEVIVSASRKAEKVQDAPASVSVISAKTMQAASSAIDPMRELINVPGVQIQQQSAARMNIEMRGASGLFGTSVFPILDYRSLIGPGIGTFQSDGSGVNSIDLARIEIVRGPGSALYGPGVTSGVVHFISKNPIDYPGTTLEVIGGQLNTVGASVRHATASRNKKFGFKVNAHYKRGDEFTLDPNDADDAVQIAKFRNTIVNPIINDLGVVSADQSGAKVIYNQSDLDPDGDGNMMQADWWNTSANATLEFRPMSDTKINASGGFNQYSSVFYNSQGEGLAQAKETWAQVRFQKRGLFAQMFYVANDGGSVDKPTFLYQTGNRSPIGRKQIEGQVQYNFLVDALNADFTVGGDYRNAISDTENQVYGRNEDDDDFTILGAYAQGKFGLAEKLDLVLAGRYDQFNFLNEGAFSPRAALVYKAHKNHTFRASYNKSVAPPTALILNIDFPVAAPVPGLFDVWLKGNKIPQSFGSNPMIDITAPGIPDLPYGIPGLPLAIPYGAVTGQILAGLQAALPANIFPAVAAILSNPANAPTGTTGTFTGYNLFTGQPMAPIDAPQAELSIQNTLEVGYKGTIGGKLGVSLDVYRIQASGFTNFTAISPTIAFTNTSLAADLGNAVEATLVPQLTAALVAAGLSAPVAAGTAAQIGAAVNGAYVQGGNGFSAAVAPLGPIFGAVETDGVPQDGLVHNAAGYRTFGNTTYWGSDLGLTYAINQDFSLFGNFSMVNQTDFDANDLGEDPNSGLTYSLNIPKNKFRLGMVYAPLTGVRGNLAFQHDDSFNAAFGQYSGPTDVKNLVDAGIGYKLESGLSVDLTCTNLFDADYRAFVNMPRIGRRAIAKLTYTFGGK
ncbi:MAG: outer membrane receptor for ferrienterochelin and colicins [Arcticibacterium sp.]|jgi:outer membrane receptor for ferrienterochelin and colicins